jgi:hypothetical protein
MIIRFNLFFISKYSWSHPSLFSPLTNQPYMATNVSSNSGILPSNDTLVCNACWTKISEKAFRTSCDHCFCAKCEASEVLLQRDRVCPLCSKKLHSQQNDDVVEFQVVGGPVLDSQLVELKSMMLAVAFANGNSFFLSFIQSIHAFEKVQGEGRC